MGHRRLAAVTPAGTVKVTGRRGVDLTGRYPELAALATAWPQREVIVDGEIVTFVLRQMSATGRSGLCNSVEARFGQPVSR